MTDDGRLELIKTAKLYVYAGKVIDVYDGDTFTLSPVDLGLWTDRRSIKLRWYGINAAELRGGTDETKAEGRRIRDIVADIVLDRWVLIVTRKDRHGNDEVGSRGRLLGEVITAPTDAYSAFVNLNRWLVTDHGVEENTYGDGPALWTEPLDVIHKPHW